eukprot:g17378.t1
MLAYGRSKRTLRFSSTANNLQYGLTESEQPSSTLSDLPAEEEDNTVSTSDRLLSSVSGRPATPTTHHSPSSPCFRTGTFVLPSHFRTDVQGRGASVKNGGGDGGMYGHQQRPDGRAPARKRFRLDMDLGSDSGSSPDLDDDLPAHHFSFAERGDFAKSHPSHLAHGSDGHNLIIGSSGAGLQLQRGSLGLGGRLGLERMGRHEPTQSSSTNNNHEQWQAAGGEGDQAWSQPGPAGCGTRGGTGRAGVGQYLNDGRRESASFVTPDHAGKWTAVVTPDNARHQGPWRASPAVNSRGDSGNARGRGRDNTGGGGERGWGGPDSGLRRMPSLIAVQDAYPPELSRIWSFQRFNAIQSVLHQTVAKSDRNVVVSAPTGCGKALCQQTLDDWTAKFAPLGVRLTELTSDSSSSASNGSVSLRDLASADVILTTPEKWDSVTRRWKAHAFLVGTVALVLVDEVHTIGEERGATLEVILSRMKMVSRSAEVVSMGLPASRMRFIALSATLPNADDFGSFLGADVFRFGDEYRPVSLHTHVVGYSSGNNPFLFDRGLNKHVPGIVARYSNGKPALVFCGSKKDTETLAGSLAQSTDYARRTGSQVVLQYLATAASNAEDPQLAKLMVKGVAIHNSGLSPQDRGLVERAFLSGSIAVLVTTTTLAMGVNLPARLVVIKGTNQYRGAKGYQELPKSAILQMMGRAGRPGFDSSGVAVVMTSQSNKRALERLSTGQEAVESSLQARLLEALNSEVCQGETIHDIGEAIEWLRSTFYFIRCQKNPSFYGLPSGLTEGDLHGHLQQTCLNGLKQLRNAGVIAMDLDEFSVQPTPHGVLFSRFMVRLESMKALMSVSESHGTREILRMCAECDELSVPVRRAEKRILNDLNKQVRYPPAKKEIVRTPADKALVLLQASLGGLPLEDWTLRGEQTSMLEAAARLLGCCAESLAVPGRGGGLGCAVSLRLMRSVRLKMWMDTELGQLRQLPGVGESLCVRLGGSHIITLLDLARAAPGKVNTIAGRKHPFGQGIRHAALQLLSRALTASVSRHQLDNGMEELQVRVEVAFQSTDSFAERYIEAPDDAYAPPPTGWRRHDTDFHLLVYYDPARSDQETAKVKRSPLPTSVEVSESESPTPQGSSKLLKSSPLLLFRKVSGESMHTATLPPKAIEDDLTIHLWLICSGVCGMDVADIRIKPSSLDDRFTSAEELRGIWANTGRGSSLTGGSEGESEGGDLRSASDRARWSDWEHSGPAPRAKHPSTTPRASTRGGGGGSGSTGKREKRGGGGGRGGRGRGRSRGKRKERVVGVAVSGVGIGGASSEGGRQLDLASSFKAGAQRALSDSARKKRASAGTAAAATTDAVQRGASAAKTCAPHKGMDRGELGGIGVSEAGDDLGVPQGSAGLSKKRKAGEDNVGTGTPYVQQQQKQLQPQPGSAGRTWGSMGRGSGEVVSGGKDIGKDIDTYNPGGRAMRTVLRKKGSEMNFSSRVGVDRLGRPGGNNNGNGGVSSSSRGERTPSRVREWLPIGIGRSGGSDGGASNGSRNHSIHREGGTSNASRGFEEDGGDDGDDDDDGDGAVIDLFPRSLGSAPSGPSEVRNQQHYPLSQQRRPQPHHQQPADISSFAYEPPPPGLSLSQQALASPSPVLTRNRPGVAPLWQPQPQRGHKTVGGADTNPPDALAAFTTVPAGATAPGIVRSAARSWDDVSTQWGKGHHASAGVRRPAAAAGEPPGNEWVMGGVRQQGGDRSSGSRVEAHGENGWDAGAARGGSSFFKTVDGYGDSASVHGGGRTAGGGGRGATSSFFSGGASGSSGRQASGPGLGDISSSAPAAPEVPSTALGRPHAAPQPNNTYATTRSARNGKPSGGPGVTRVRGVAGGATAAEVQNPKKTPHESPTAIAPIAVTISRAGESCLNSIGRAGAGGIAPGASPAEIGGSGGRKNNGNSTGRSTTAASRTVRHGSSGGGVRRTEGLSGAGTSSTPRRNGEREGRVVGGGGVGASCGDVATTPGGGGEEGGGPEDVEKVAKKLDFHTLFD